MEVQQSIDLLDVDEAALVCSTSSSLQTNLPNNHQSQVQDNMDPNILLTPSPTNADPMEVPYPMIS